MINLIHFKKEIMQTKKQSFIETLTNIAIGFSISLIATFFIFPLFNIESTIPKNIGITLFYTAISIVRSYTVRRWFNKTAYTNKLPDFAHTPKPPVKIWFNKKKTTDYDEAATTCIQLLANAAGAEFEDEHMAIDIIAETIEKA